jgi:hypothetical protein
VDGRGQQEAGPAVNSATIAASTQPARKSPSDAAVTRSPSKVTRTATPSAAVICRFALISADPVAARLAGSDVTPAAITVPRARPTPVPPRIMLGSRSRT